MIYGVGTGRCGTMTLANIMGGLHEPKPRMDTHAAAWARGDHSDHRKQRLRYLIGVREGADTPIISDLEQSWVIPLILEDYPQSEFIWLLRDPESCISSLQKYTDGFYRICPEGQRIPKWTPFQKMAWYYYTVNTRIQTDLTRVGCQLIFTQDLGPDKHNVWDARPKTQYTSIELSWLEQAALPFWEDYEGIRL